MLSRDTAEDTKHGPVSMRVRYGQRYTWAWWGENKDLKEKDGR